MTRIEELTDEINNRLKMLHIAEISFPDNDLGIATAEALVKMLEPDNVADVVFKDGGYTVSYK